MADKPIKGSPIAFSDKTIAKALTNIYRKKFNIKTEIEPELFLETVRLFNLASATGISDAVGAGTAMPNDDFLQAIKTNNEVFSAFRVHKMQNDIAKLMTDGDGKLKSFSKFAKDVKPYTNHKNRAWLQTEYNTAVLRAHQAADWQQFEREKDVLPNLEWMPSTSTHPGEDHRPFWGTILPIDDPFWNEHRPGDRWNCKCRLRSTGEPVCSPPNATSSNLTPNRGLENNPGKDGKIFSDKHPYMPQSCSACPFGSGKLTSKECAKCKQLKKATEPPPILGDKEIITAKNLNKALYNVAQANGWFQNGEFNKIRKSTNWRYNGSTDREGNITLHEKHLNNCISAFEKIRTGQSCTTDEERSMATLWHEITHNKHKNVLIYDKNKKLQPDYPGSDKSMSRKYMELANEFVARKTLPEFYESLGGKMSYPEYMNNRTNTGYNDWVVKYQKAISDNNLDEGKVLESVKKHLFNERYDSNYQGLVNALVDNSAGKITKQKANDIVEECLKITH